MLGILIAKQHKTKRMVLVLLSILIILIGIILTLFK